MGHTQCTSKAPHTEAPVVHRGHCGLGANAPALPLAPPRTLHRCTPLPEFCAQKCDHLTAGADPAQLEPNTLEPNTLEPNTLASSHHAERLQDAMADLHQCGWYWGSVTASEARQLLQEAVDGSFLLRNSSSPDYLLTLSVRTPLGTTHLRIAYSGGEFGFDSTTMARPQLRRFKGAVNLVQHYAFAHRREAESGDAPVQVGLETPLQLKLARPLCRATHSLQHLCRVVINQHSRNHTGLDLPGPLTNYLLDYPFLL